MHTITKSIAIFATAVLLFNAIAPTLAQAAKHLQGEQVNANALVRDAYIAVTYYDGNNRERTAKGWIDAIGETSFTIRSGGLKGKTTIAYAKVLSIIMSESSTVPAKQMNEVNQFIRNMKAREIGRAKREGKAERLKGEGIKAQGGVRGDGRPFRNARVRVYAPAISKKRIIGRIASMTQDTLVIEGPGWIFMPGRRTPVEKERTFYRVPLSAITNTEVSMGQRRNTYKGLVIGMGIGVALFAIASDEVEEEEGPFVQISDRAAIGLIAVPICLLSTLMGAATKSEKWAEVSPQRLNLSIAPTSTKGLRAALTVNF